MFMICDRVVSHTASYLEMKTFIAIVTVDY